MHIRKYWEFETVVTQRQTVDTPADATETEARALLRGEDWQEVDAYDASTLVDAWEEEEWEAGDDEGDDDDA